MTTALALVLSAVLAVILYVGAIVVEAAIDERRECGYHVWEWVTNAEAIHRRCLNCHAVEYPGRSGD